MLLYAFSIFSLQDNLIYAANGNRMKVSSQVQSCNFAYEINSNLTKISEAYSCSYKFIFQIKVILLIVFLFLYP